MLFLNVPYSEKDEAKALGAKWNPDLKKWYVVDRNDYYKFSKWILNNSANAIIAFEYIHIIEGMQTCWKCGKETRVIGLGIGEGMQFYGDYNNPQIEIFEDYVDPGEEIHLSWSDIESDIPPKLLKYLKQSYSVKTVFSKTLERYCFANCCDHCGVLQGNWFLFNEPDSPFSTSFDENELLERMANLKIFAIPIDDDLLLNWNMWISQNDYAYLKYGQVKDLILSNNLKNEWISYEELYSL